MAKFDWLTDYSRRFLANGYLSEGEVAETRIKDISDNAENILGIEGFSDKFYDYMAKGWYSLSSPVWSNFGKDRGYPVSCFNSDVGDSISDILYTQAEVGMMSKLGGGTSGYFGNVRPRGSDISDNGKTSGSVHFMELFQSVTNVVSQGNTRRGRMAPYLPIDHGDIEEFLDIGTEGHPIQNMTHGVTVSDNWMESMISGDKDKRRIWAKLLKVRSEIGYPYIMFTDNANRQKPKVYKDKQLEIMSSNLCSEIMLPSSSEESFVCVLSSINLAKYDEWKDTDAVETLVYFLDAVNEEFISKLEILRDSTDKEDNHKFFFMERAYNFAKNHRAVGAGVLGWHSLLQSKMYSFESKEAAKLNVEVFKLIQNKSIKASKELAEMFGEPEVLKGCGMRNTCVNAVAPTVSSSFILGQVSPSIEPMMSNYYIKDLAKLKAEMKNPELKKLLESKGKDTKETWDSISKADGSVQHLEFLTEHEKDVFLTFKEISPEVIINQAAIRQDYIDQGQSLNLLLTSDMKVKEVNKLIIDAWKLGIKSLYYQHSVNASREFLRSRNSSCVACEA